MKKNTQLNLEMNRVMYQRIAEDKIKVNQEAKRLSDNNQTHDHYLLEGGEALKSDAQNEKCLVI